MPAYLSRMGRDIGILSVASPSHASEEERVGPAVPDMAAPPGLTECDFYGGVRVLQPFRLSSVRVLRPFLSHECPVKVVCTCGGSGYGLAPRR